MTRGLSRTLPCFLIASLLAFGGLIPGVRAQTPSPRPRAGGKATQTANPSAAMQAAWKPPWGARFPWKTLRPSSWLMRTPQGVPACAVEGSMRRALTGLYFVVSLVQCHPQPRPAPKPLAAKAGTLKILSFNVNWGGVDMGRSARAILATRADIVALQETTPAWERALRGHRGLKARYPYKIFKHYSGAGGMAFLSRYPLRTVTVSPPPGRAWFPAWLVEARLPRGKVRLLNVHLRPPIGDSGRISSIPSAYFTTRGIRLREIQRHFKKVPSGGPLVVLGDFNESETGRATRWLGHQGLRSALASHDPEAPTWRWRTSLYTFRARLDHIYYRGMQCLGAQVLGEAASDHYPVEAVFAF